MVSFQQRVFSISGKQHMNNHKYIIMFLCICFFYCSCLNSLIYHPEKNGFVSDAYPFAIEDVYINVAEHITIHGWFIPAHKATFTVLFFHGNAGNIADRAEKIQMLLAIPLSVFIIDYRGFGKSGGKPSEEGLYADALASFHYLINEKKLSPHNIIIYGESLGGAVAAYCAAQTNPAGLILDSAFTSISSMVAFHSAGFLSLFFTEQYPTIDYVASIRCPVLILHSKDDEITPFEMGKTLYAASTSKHKRFVQLRGGHNNNFLVDSFVYINSIKEFVSSIYSEESK